MILGKNFVSLSPGGALSASVLLKALAAEADKEEEIDLSLELANNSQ